MMTAMKTVIIFHSCSLSADHEVRDADGHADGSTWEMYLPGTIVNTQGIVAGRKVLLCEYRGRGLLVCGAKKGGDDHIH